MTEDQEELLLKAQQSLAAAQLLLGNNYTDFAASRAYYAMFYAAEALLEGDGLSFSSHSGVISALEESSPVPSGYQQNSIAI